MKLKLRIASLLVACVCAVGSIASFSASATVLRGDVNGDGYVDITDAVSLNRYLAGGYKVTNMSALDYDRDYIISRADSDALYRFLVHLV
ncbi:MAG: dockerin type I repeat-containing protein [Ruminococcus sp.]